MNKICKINRMNKISEINKIFLISAEFANVIGVSLLTIKNQNRDDIFHSYMRTLTGKRLYTQVQIQKIWDKGAEE